MEINSLNTAFLKAVAKKNANRQLSRMVLLTSACAIALFGISQNSYAQDAQKSDETVVVTGSRIKANGYERPSAVTVVSAQSLQAAAPMTITDGLVQLPQLIGSTSRTFCCAVGSLGNFLNLRGLGPTRTLILLDGERVVATRESGEIDVNLLPEMLIQRVDIVTGGASAAYGSDAVSGVVNYVVNNKYKGFGATAQYGQSTYSDDASVKIGIAGGTDLFQGRGHIVASYEHFKVDGIESLNDRPDSRRGGFLAGNGSVAAPFKTVEGVYQYTATDGGVIVNAGNAPIVGAGAPLAGLMFLPGGSTRNFIIGTPITGSAGFAYGGDGFRNNEMQPAGLLETDKLYSKLTFDFTDATSGYVRFNATKSHNHMRILSDNRSTAASYTIYRDNAYLSPAMASAMDSAGVSSFRLARFNRDFGAIALDYENKNYDISAGLKGRFNEKTKWQLSVGHGETEMNAQVQNVSNLAKAYAAADAVVNPANNQIVCRITLTNPSLYPDCLPMNLFGYGAPSEASKKFVLGHSDQYVKNTQTILSAEMQGELFTLPAGPVDYAIGGEYRYRTLLETSNQVALEQIKATGIQGIPGVYCPTIALCRYGGWNQGNFGVADAHDDVTEGFVELQAPLLKNAPLAKSLDFNAAYRYTDYKNSGTVGTWKLGFTYEPIEDLRLRATRSRDIRAPNLFELYAGAVNAFTPGLTDPVTGANNVIAVTRTQGNPNLLPEIADTTSYGLVFKPHWLKGFSGSVDYYDIDLSGALATTTAQGTLDQCKAGIAAQCALITRDPATNNIQQIIIQQINLNGRQIKGIDFDLSYNRDLGPGKLNIRSVFTNTIDYIDKIGTARIQSAGWFSTANNLAIPKWRGNLNATYSVGNYSIFVQERYIGSYLQMPPIAGQIFAEPKIPAVYYTDVTLSAKLKLFGADAEIYATANNIFQKRPPFVANRFAANLGFPTIPTLYDLDNGYYTIGTRIKF